MIIIDGENLKIEDVVAVARNYEKIELSEKSIKNVRENRSNLEKLIASGAIVYGVNTGYGDLVNTRISHDDMKKLQKNLIMSHSVGVGKYFDLDIVRATMLIRLNTLLKAKSGVRPEVLILLKELLNKNVVPAIPEKGSVGSSGDLAPLAHMTLVMIGKGKAFYHDKLLEGNEALKLASILPIELSYKEGVALINGTSVMSGVAALNIHDSINLLKNSLIASSLTLEALNGNDDAFDPKILSLRPHEGQVKTGAIVKSMVEESKIIEEAKKFKIQDAYSLRCIPQVAGAVYDTIVFAKNIVETELNSVTDNPIILERAYSGGNFHGEYIGFAMDYLGIAMAELANIAERRIARMVDHKLSDLPAFLIENSGLNSGMMMIQYTAAALVSENKVLAHPATVDSIPTSANQEDHVSMGTIAARKGRDIINNVKHVIAIEYLVASQALEYRKHEMAKNTEIAYKLIRKGVNPLTEDREMGEDVRYIIKMIDEKTFNNNLNFVDRLI
ncbi:MAG: histidine ammonia-lyase [Thermoplasmata archaeon]